MRLWFRRQWGFGPVFAVEAIAQVVKVRREAITSVEQQRS